MSKKFIEALLASRSASFTENVILNSITPDLEAFEHLLDNYPSKKSAVLGNVRVREKLLAVMAEKKGFISWPIEKLKALGVEISTKELVELKKKGNFESAELDFLLRGANPRVEKLYDFMSEYAAGMDAGRIEYYKKEINFNNIDRTAVKTKKVVAGKWVDATRNVKTGSQKEFEAVYPIFVEFMADHITPDFLNVLSILDLNFTKYLKKIASLDVGVMNKVCATIDMESYCNSLSDRERQNLQNVMSEFLVINTYITYALHWEDKGKTSAKRVVNAVLDMKEKGYTVKTINTVLDIMGSKLRKTFDTAESGSEIFYSKMLPEYKTNSKVGTAKLNQFMAELEKDKLQKLISVPKKVAIHKL